MTSPEELVNDRDWSDLEHAKDAKGIVCRIVGKGAMLGTSSSRHSVADFGALKLHIAGHLAKGAELVESSTSSEGVCLAVFHLEV